MVNKKVLITGATGAIGKATAMELAKNNCEVILLGRDQSKLETVKSEIINDSGNNKVDFVIADLSEIKSIKKAVEEIRKKTNVLNALVHVAAIFKSGRLENSVGHEYMFATNHLGPFFLTQELMDLLKAGQPSRVITVSAPSFTKINFDDIHGKQKFSAGFTGAFGASKMMNLMFAYTLARHLKGSGVNSMVFHPGLVKTELTREMPAFLHSFFKLVSSSPDKAARMLCKLAIDKEYENSNGMFYTANGKVTKSNAYSYGMELQEKLWNLSEKMIAGIQ